jgi:hypothetical protein
LTSSCGPCPTAGKSRSRSRKWRCPTPAGLSPSSKASNSNRNSWRFPPNNRIPAIVDPQGPGGSPVSIFESGAILQYLGRKTGRFYPADERGRMEVEKWLFWQMAGVGPMFGQNAANVAAASSMRA